MQVFVPYPSPLDTAMCLDAKRLEKQIAECDQILSVLDGDAKGRKSHPIFKMYRPYADWLSAYRQVLSFFSVGDEAFAKWYIDYANNHRPPFLTKEFCDQHKRRLYTKSPALYPQFAELGTSEENWYVVDGELVKYVGGKKV